MVVAEPSVEQLERPILELEWDMKSTGRYLSYLVRFFTSLDTVSRVCYESLERPSFVLLKYAPVPVLEGGWTPWAIGSLGYKSSRFANIGNAPKP